MDESVRGGDADLPDKKAEAQNGDVGPQPHETSASSTFATVASASDKADDRQAENAANAGEPPQPVPNRGHGDEQELPSSQTAETEACAYVPLLGPPSDAAPEERHEHKDEDPPLPDAGSKDRSLPLHESVGPPDEAPVAEPVTLIGIGLASLGSTPVPADPADARCEGSCDPESAETAPSHALAPASEAPSTLPVPPHQPDQVAFDGSRPAAEVIQQGPLSKEPELRVDGVGGDLAGAAGPSDEPGARDEPCLEPEAEAVYQEQSDASGPPGNPGGGVHGATDDAPSAVEQHGGDAEQLLGDELAIAPFVLVADPTEEPSLPGVAHLSVRPEEAALDSNIGPAVEIGPTTTGQGTDERPKRDRTDATSSGSDATDLGTQDWSARPGQLGEPSASDDRLDLIAPEKPPGAQLQEDQIWSGPAGEDHDQPGDGAPELPHGNEGPPQSARVEDALSGVFGAPSQGYAPAPMLVGPAAIGAQSVGKVEAKVPTIAWPSVPIPTKDGREERRPLVRYARAASFVALALFAFTVMLIVVYRWINPPASTLMIGQSLLGGQIEQRWVPIQRISPHLVRAVVLSEDGAFCRHHGVDWTAMGEAIESARGGSTITMQVVKNLFLWPARSYIRKALEILLAHIVEVVWPKQRILEIYLNIVEWGPGVFGAEAAARNHFGKRAAQLTAHEAALLAVSLPNPIERQAGHPGWQTRRLANNLLIRMRSVRGPARCMRGGQ